MPRITALTTLPRQPGRVSVEIDGAAVGVVFAESLTRLSLSPGREVDPAALDALGADVAALKTYDRALRLLAARGRSVRELRRRLLLAKEPEIHVDAAIARLETLGALDDEQYARSVARSHLVGRGHAPRRIKQELARRGVARDVADRAIEMVVAEDAAPGSLGAESGVDLTETMERLARKKLRSLGTLEPETRARRLYAFLARRGYESDDIRRVLQRITDPPADSESA